MPTHEDQIAAPATAPSQPSAAPAQASIGPSQPGLPQPLRAGGGAPAEIGGRQGPDPTRYGDWELRGRCIDF
jgi:hypothetical protein